MKKNKQARKGFISTLNTKKHIFILGFSIILIAIGLSFQYKVRPDKWMTYRDFDVKAQKNFINYLLPGVPDSSSNKQYDFNHKHYPVLFFVLVLFFPGMLVLRIIFDTDVKLRIFRFITQWLCFVIARLGIFRVTGICPVKRTGLGIFPFMNCQSCELATGACPLGTLQMSILNRQVPLILIGQIILVGILSGRWVCGWLCPFGFLLDIFDKIPGKKIKVNIKFSLIKYVFLGIFLISTIAYFFKDKSEFLFYCSFICPVGFYFGVLEYALTTGLGALTKEFPFFHLMLIYHFFIGVMVIVGSIKLGGRFICKYLCPLGTLYGLFSKIAIFKLKINSNKCNGCKLCKEVCPMYISILDKSFISRSNCIVCGRCRKVCPVNKIEYSFAFSEEYHLLNAKFKN